MDERVGAIRLDCLRRRRSGERFFEPSQLYERPAAIVERFGVVRLEFERSVAAFNRLPGCASSRSTAPRLLERLDEVRPMAASAMSWLSRASSSRPNSWSATPRLVRASKQSGLIASILVVTCHGLFEPLQLAEHRGLIVERVD